MTYQEILEAARPLMGGRCMACPVCNGKACGNKIPGPGAKGIGDTAIRNFNKWQEIRVNMDTICGHEDPNTSLDLFGKQFRYPFFVGPLGAVKNHYGEKFDDFTYNDIMVHSCYEGGIAAFTGDGVNPSTIPDACKAIADVGGIGIPTIKPWNLEVVEQKLAHCKAAGAFAVAMDIDGAGLPFLKNFNPPAGSKTVEELARIAQMAGVPFIVKGIMTVKGALKAKEAGAAGIVVSNHGGRVLDQCPATAEVLADIVDALKGSGMKIFVDGGIRSGVDIFKALALGADAVIICRPFVPMIYGGGAEGVRLLIDKLGAELEDTMRMCGAKSLEEITRDMVFIK